jgi:hydrogenase-1 operon protein HyaF
MGLADIPVRVENAAAGLTGNAQALLVEIAALLQRMLATGEGGAIDLAGLPFSPADRAWLEQRLGRGEVEIRLMAAGLSTFTETACPGVWWVSHHNEAGVRVSELIEVAPIPELVIAHPDDMKIGFERLNNLLNDLN